MVARAGGAVAQDHRRPARRALVDDDLGARRAGEDLEGGAARRHRGHRGVDRGGNGDGGIGGAVRDHAGGGVLDADHQRMGGVDRAADGDRGGAVAVHRRQLVLPGQGAAHDQRHGDGGGGEGGQPDQQVPRPAAAAMHRVGQPDVDHAGGAVADRGIAAGVGHREVVDGGGARDRRRRGPRRRQRRRAGAGGGVRTIGSAATEPVTSTTRVATGPSPVICATRVPIGGGWVRRAGRPLPSSTDGSAPVVRGAREARRIHSDSCSGVASTGDCLMNSSSAACELGGGGRDRRAAGSRPTPPPVASGGGTWGATCSMRGKLPSRIVFIASTTSPRSTMLRPASSSHSTTPSENTSLRPSSGLRDRLLGRHVRVLALDDARAGSRRPCWPPWRCRSRPA